MEATAEGAAEVSRLEQAAEALAIQEPAASQEAEVQPETSEEPGTLADVFSKEDSQPEPEPEPKPEPEPEPKPEEEPEAKPHNIGKEYRALRKRKRQLEKREQEFLQKEQTFEASQARLEKGLELVRLMQDNPEKALEELASMSGSNSDEFYERLTTQRLSGGEVPEETPAMREIKRLREELAQKDQLAKERDERLSQERQQAQFQAEVTSYVKEMCSIPDVEEYAQKWPNLAAMRPDILEARSNYAVKWAIENSPNSTLVEVADALDEIVGEEYNFALKRLGGIRGSGTPSEEVKPEGLGNPAQAKPKSVTLTNNDAAVSSRRVAHMSRQDRMKAAASALPDLVAMLNS